MGDFNTKLGKGRREDVVGDYRLGNPNEGGNQMVQLCQGEGLI